MPIEDLDTFSVGFRFVNLLFTRFEVGGRIFGKRWNPKSGFRLSVYPRAYKHFPRRTFLLGFKIVFFGTLLVIFLFIILYLFPIRVILRHWFVLQNWCIFILFWTLLLFNFFVALRKRWNKMFRNCLFVVFRTRKKVHRTNLSGTLNWILRFF